MDYYLLTAIIAPFLLSPCFLLLKGKRMGVVFSLIALISFVSLLLCGGPQGWNEAELITIPWVPSLSLNFTFLVDGLSLFFGLLVSGMGVLVGIYSSGYMPQSPKLRRFYLQLSLFMGAMLGAVFSNNLLLLFLFWEFTGITSFLLIGYNNEKSASLNGARLAFLTTCFTSLFLLVGIALISYGAHTLNISDLLAMKDMFTEQSWWQMIAIGCFLIGIFGKSAQIPFYFWLPNAMAAPTPVSAYLHAATLVKLGIFLAARMYPVFVLSAIWFPVVTSVCFTTMILGAIASLLANDLKAILAYATVSQLGFFLGFYGMGGVSGIEYDLVHIFNHALYKGSLFMLVGIVDHATGIRDIRKLGGLGKRLPLTTVIFFIAAGAMAGIPGTTGFLSKELLFEELSILQQSLTLGSVIFGVLITALIFKVAFSFRLFYHLFVREKGEAAPAVHIHHPPSFTVQLPPLILSSLALFFGIFPEALERFADLFYLKGLQQPIATGEHGNWGELLLTALIFGLGTVLFFLMEKSGLWWHDLPTRFNLGTKVSHWYQQLPKWADALVIRTTPMTLKTQLYLLLTFYGVAMLPKSVPRLVQGSWLLTASAIPIVLSVAAILFVKGNLRQVIAFAASGFFLTFFFLVFQQPDLAMTQILVDVVTLMLLLFLLYKQKTTSAAPPLIPRLLLSGLVATAGALLFGLLSNKPAVNPLGMYYIDNALPLAKGENAVNTILVDFRGLDTFGEITVLFLAALGIYGLFYPRGTGWEISKGNVRPLQSPLFAAVVPLIFLLTSLLSIYLLLKGHNSPGGGFIGGLALAIGLVLIMMSRSLTGGLGQKINMMQIAGIGLFIAYLVALLPAFFGFDIMKHYWFTGTNTPLYFDIGVFLVVIGVTARIVRLLRQEVYGGQAHD